MLNSTYLQTKTNSLVKQIKDLCWFLPDVFPWLIILWLMWSGDLPRMYASVADTLSGLVAQLTP